MVRQNPVLDFLASDEEIPVNSPLAVEVPLALSICVSYIVVAIAIHEYKRVHGSAPWIHESSVSCLLGLLLGGVVKAFASQTIQFNKNFFFYLVLPPIIFSAGYGLKKKRFFQHLHLVLLFGVFGTMLNFLIIALGARYYPGISSLSWKESFLMAAVLCGTDEVSALSIVPISTYPRLGALVFGEGVINDALSIVLFEAFMPQGTEISSRLVLQAIAAQLLCSAMIGTICGLALSAAMKHVASLRRYSIYQTALVALCGYLAYAIAEALALSGILTLFICALVLSHYCFYSLSRVAQVATKISFASVADMAEGFAFAYVGLSLWACSMEPGLDVAFTVYMLAVLLLGRLACVLLLSACYARCGAPSMPLREQLAFALAGSVRGSLCWAQALQVDCAQIYTAALLLVMFTTVLGGVLLPLALPSLLVGSPPAAPSDTPAVGTLSALRYQPISDGPDGHDGLPAAAGYGAIRSPSEASEATLRTTPCKLIHTLPRGGDVPATMLAGSVAPRAGWLSRLFLHWVVLDETALKPLFGGSQPDGRRKQLLRSVHPAGAGGRGGGGGGGETASASVSVSALDLAFERARDVDEALAQCSLLTEDSLLSVQDEAIRDYFASPNAAEGLARRGRRGLFSPDGSEGPGGDGDGDGDEDEAYLSHMSRLLELRSPPEGLQLLATTPPRGEESDSWLDMSTLSHLHNGRQPHPPLTAVQPLRPPHSSGRPVYPAPSTPYSAGIGRLSDNSLLSPIPKTHTRGV